jgi:hypothetical protein
MMKLHRYAEEIRRKAVAEALKKFSGMEIAIGDALPSLSNYFGFQRNPGYAGELADQQSYEASTFINTESIAINFGCAVARDNSNSGNVGGLSATSGGVGNELLPCKAPTLGYAEGGTNLVNYPQNASVPVCKRGMIWCQPVENVLVGAKVISITSQNGALGGSNNDPGGGDISPAPAVQATGSIIFTANPTAGDTVTIDGVAITFETSGATGNQVNLGATAAATCTALAAFLNASTNSTLELMTYYDSGTGTLEIVAVAAGTAGNAYTLATSDSASITVSGSTLTGGTAAVDTGRVIVPGAFWEMTGSAGGQVLKVRINSSSN